MNNERRDLIFRVYGHYGLDEAKLTLLTTLLANHFMRIPDLRRSIVVYAEILGELTPHIARLEALIVQLRTEVSPCLNFAYEVLVEAL